jgi:hypothetical protein
MTAPRPDWTHVTPDLLAAIRAQYRLDWHGVHGIRHWERVRENGRRLAETTGADVVVVEFFAALHDSRRFNDYRDPQHGARAAELVRELDPSLVPLSSAQLDVLAEACRTHTSGTDRRPHHRHLLGRGSAGPAPRGHPAGPALPGDGGGPGPGGDRVGHGGVAVELVTRPTVTPPPHIPSTAHTTRHTSASMKHGGEHSPSSVRRHARRVEAEDAVRESEEARPREPDTHRRRASSPSELLAMAQGAVWHSVAESSHRSGVYSETGALDHVYAERREGLEERAARFPLEPEQVGLMAFLYGAPVGLDLLPGKGLYEQLHHRLVRAYLFESVDAAADRRDRGKYAGSVDVPCPDSDGFLAAALEAARIPRETVGLGTYAVVSGPDIFGAELAVEGDLVHLSAFNGIK